MLIVNNKNETTCFMFSKEYQNDYSVFVNENFEYGSGGYSFEILDFAPEDVENYKPLYISRTSQSEELKAKDARIAELEADLNILNKLVRMIRANKHIERIKELELHKLNHPVDEVETLRMLMRDMKFDYENRIKELEAENEDLIKEIKERYEVK